MIVSALENVDCKILVVSDDVWISNEQFYMFHIPNLL